MLYFGQGCVWLASRWRSPTTISMPEPQQTLAPRPWISVQSKFSRCNSLIVRILILTIYEMFYDIRFGGFTKHTYSNLRTLVRGWTRASCPPPSTRSRTCPRPGLPSSTTSDTLGWTKGNLGYYLSHLKAGFAVVRHHNNAPRFHS